MISAIGLVTTVNDSDGIDAVISWFVFENSTYVYEDMTVGSYNETGDIIVELQGILDLSGLDADSFVFN